MKRVSPSKARHLKKALIRRWNRGLPQGFVVGLIGSPLGQIKVHAPHCDASPCVCWVAGKRASR